MCQAGGIKKFNCGQMAGLEESLPAIEPGIQFTLTGEVKLI